MSFEKFKFIMNILLEFQRKRDKISDFFEQELMEDSFCFVTLGTPVEDALVNLVADEFDCWYSFDLENGNNFAWWEKKNHMDENEIANWLYSLNDIKEIHYTTADGKEYRKDVTSLESLYEYLVESYKEKHNLTK